MTEERIIYIVTRLFDFAEKLKAEWLEQAVLKGIQSACSFSYPRANALSTFIPFRDTAQNTLGVPNQARFIYEADLARLKKLFGIIGYFDGVSKDEGICMELGYAYALSKPILLIATDFLVYKLKQSPSVRFYYDPILTRMTGHLIRNCVLPKSGSFEQRLLTAISSLHNRVGDKVTEYILHPDKFTGSLPSPTVRNTERPLLLIEFGGGLFEWQQMLALDLQSVLMQQTNCDVAITERYISGSTTARQAGENDIALALAADLLIVCADSEEMNAGSAALVGLGRALNKPIVLYDSKATLSFAEGGQEMSRNLMIDCAVDKSVSKFDDIPEAVIHLLETRGFGNQ